MNAVLDNPFTRAMSGLGASLPRPEAILCVSAHWLGEEGLQFSGAGPLETIYDFYGFPDELYRIVYEPPPAAGKAAEAAALIPGAQVVRRGLDHGAWTVLRMMYPDADIPVFQLSVNYPAPGRTHYTLGRRLAPLRDKGVLIVGSGNIVHNLELMKPSMEAGPFGWAEEFDAAVLERASSPSRRAELADYAALPSADLAVPTPDHYWPFLTALGAGLEDAVTCPFEGFHHASLSMRAFKFG